VAHAKRASYADEHYWGRAVPGFGDSGAWLLAVGLAPGAHGANRTGRMFTGDRSGDWLFAALHRAGLCSQAESVGIDDGLQLFGVWITAAVRCAPPANKPSTKEWAGCRPYLIEELEALNGVTVAVALGGFAFQRLLQVLPECGHEVPRPRPAFRHGTEVRLERLTVIASYHPSQQNTFTGRLTETMFDHIWQRALLARGQA
jgi:uracil-DNA glycosylase family 4